MQNQCSHCSKQTQECIPCPELKCTEKICFACLNTVYSKQMGNYMSTIKLPCGHKRDSGQIREIVRSRCCKCCKKIGKYYYEMRDGRKIDAACFEGYPNKTIKEMEMSQCKECKSKIGMSTVRQTKLPSQKYIYNHPLCSDCQKKAPTTRQNNFLKTKQFEKDVIVKQKSPIKTHEVKKIEQVSKPFAYKEGQCVNCSRKSIHCVQICQGTVICYLCKFNESRYYDKKEDQSFRPQLFGKISQTTLTCFRCNKAFYHSELIKNLQTGRLCCKDCDWTLKQQEKKRLEKERIQDSILNEDITTLAMKSEAFPKPNLIPQSQQEYPAEEKGNIYTQKYNKSTTIKVQTKFGGTTKKDQKGILNQIRKIGRKQCPEPEQYDPDMKKKIAPKLNITILQPMNQCKLCKVLLDSDSFAFSPNMPNLRNLCLGCAIERLNVMKKQKSVERKAKSLSKPQFGLKNTLISKHHLLSKDSDQRAKVLQLNFGISPKMGQSSLKKKKMRLIGNKPLFDQN